MLLIRITYSRVLSIESVKSTHPNEKETRERGEVGAHFVVVGKPIPDFQIPVQLSNFDILSGFSVVD